VVNVTDSADIQVCFPNVFVQRHFKFSFVCLEVQV